MDPCSRCGTDVALNVRFCPVCNEHHGYPNVKQAVADAEALALRAEATKQRARARDSEAQLNELVSTLEKSLAVVNVDLGFLHDFLTSHILLYSGYPKQVQAGVRQPALAERDRQRTAVEGILFGTWASEVTYAALSTDGNGLSSYGSVSLTLKDLAIEARASVLERNSYHFVQQHRLVPGDPLPAGFRAPWSERVQIGIAKLGDRVEPTTTVADHAPLVLSAGSTRDDDEFIEVHIYGSFGRGAVVNIRSEAPTNEVDLALHEASREKAASLGMSWS